LTAGWHAKRFEFEPEWDNEAEQAIADLEFKDDDSPEEVAGKLRMLDIYNKRLDEVGGRLASPGALRVPCSWTPIIVVKSICSHWQVLHCASCLIGQFYQAMHVYSTIASSTLFHDQGAGRNLAPSVGYCHGCC
jgi:hypothetical protein